MTIQQYIPLASRTRVDLGSDELNIDHMILGVATEIGELLDIHKKHLAYNKPIDWVNYKEEIGDLAWYFAGYANIKNIEIDDSCLDYDIPIFLNRQPYHVIMLIGNQIIEQIKNEEKTVVASWFSLINLILKHHNLGSLSDVMETNIAKLQKRYPNSYNDLDALNRNLEEERRVLEK